MTYEQFEKAKLFEEELEHIDKILEELNKHDFQLKPPTRMSGFTLRSGFHDVTFILSEGEITIFKKALVNERHRIEQEFGRL